MTDYIPSIVLLTDLLNDREVLSNVSNLLNPRDGWEYLCEILIEIKALPVDKTIKTYKKYNHGGGSPALSLLEAVKTKKVKLLRKTEKDELTLEDLVATASKFKRNDIVDYLKTVEKATLKELLLSQLIKLSEFLEICVPGVKNWKNFASHYGYSYNEIQNFCKTVRAPNCYNATEVLLGDVLEINPQFTLKEFIKYLETVNRNDVVGIVKEFEKKMQHERNAKEKNEAAKLNQENKNPQGNSSKKKKRKRKRKNKKFMQNEVISDCGGIRPGEQPELPHHEQEQPELIHHGQEQPELPYHGQEQPELPYHGQEQPELPYQGQEQPELPYHGQEQPELPYKGQEQPELPDHGQEQPELPYHGQEQPELPSHGQEQPELPSHGQEQPELPYHGQAQPELPDHGQELPELPYQGQDQPEISRLERYHPELLHSVEGHSNLSNSGIMYQEEESDFNQKETFETVMKPITLTKPPFASSLQPEDLQYLPPDINQSKCDSLDQNINQATELPDRNVLFGAIAFAWLVVVISVLYKHSWV